MTQVHESWRRTLLALAGAALLAGSTVAGASGPSDAGDDRVERLEQRIRELERTLATLKDEAGGAEDERLEELERQIRVLAGEIENLRLGEAAEPEYRGRRGLGPAASKVYATDRGVSIGGYGEMLYENFDSRREDGSPSGQTDQLDFLRAVLYFGYKFNDRILFNSEIEYEHASTGRDGEVSLEFAYLDFLFRDAVNVRAGLLLMPMGFVNELHEPPVFLGAIRPFVEQRLIPSTWRENGAGVYGSAGPVSYRVYVTNSLAAVAGTSSEASGFGAGGIRDGRTKGSKSSAEDLAVVGRIDWDVTRWLTLGGSMFTGHAGQGAVTPGGQSVGARTTLREVHAEARWRGLQARGLFVETDIDDVDRINAAQGFTGAESVGEKQYGWYGEIGYDVLSRVDGSAHEVIPYVRYERFDTQDRVPAGFAADPANDVTVTTVGVSWKPILNVALKVDYNRIENEARTGVDRVAAALGFLF